jgi:GTPase
MVDRAEIIVRAGKGGDGIVHFLRAKYQPKGGPDGGDGGRGGAVYFVVDPNLNTLRDFRMHQVFEAGDGGAGQGQLMSGKNGETIDIHVPLGTVVHEVKDGETRVILDLSEPGRRVRVARGGRGGIGNDHFKSSTNQTPMYAIKGEAGQERHLILELKLLADVGLIGLPNAGKSTLLSVITSATPKIANYPFTTLEPNLGVLRVLDKSIVIADIPGLIEGASEGKGLGDDFLRHVERTRMLVHLIAAEEQGNVLSKEEVLDRYEVIRKELSNYNETLKYKPEIVVISKIDQVDNDWFEAVKEHFEQKRIPVLGLSAVTHKGLEELIEKLI